MALPFLATLLASKAAPAIVSAGASLINGARNRAATRKANEANSPAGQVRQWEEAGVNPLVGITQATYTPQMPLIGNSLAEAGRALADGWSENIDDKLQQTAVAKENEQLRDRITALEKVRIPGHLQQVRYALPVVGGRDEEAVDPAGDPDDVADGDADTGDDGDKPLGPVEKYGLVLGDAYGNRQKVSPFELDPVTARTYLSVPAVDLLGLPLRGSGDTSPYSEYEESTGDFTSMPVAPVIGMDLIQNTAEHYLGGSFDELGHRYFGDTQPFLIGNYFGAKGQPRKPTQRELAERQYRNNYFNQR